MLLIFWQIIHKNTQCGQVEKGGFNSNPQKSAGQSLGAERKHWC